MHIVATPGMSQPLSSLLPLSTLLNPTYPCRISLLRSLLPCTQGTTRLHRHTSVCRSRYVGLPPHGYAGLTRPLLCRLNLTRSTPGHHFAPCLDPTGGRPPTVLLPAAAVAAGCGSSGINVVPIVLRNLICWRCKATCGSLSGGCVACR